MPHMSERVGIRKLQQNASAVVRHAAQGDVIEITDRGRPIARIVPISGGRLAALASAGLARPARCQASGLPPPLPAQPDRPTLGELLAQARADER